MARKLQGHAGADLDENGVRLAEVTAEGMKDIPFDLCFTSPLIRAKHTAEIILAGRSVPIIEEPRIMEISFGNGRGSAARRAVRKSPETGLKSFIRRPVNTRGAGRRNGRGCVQANQRFFSGADRQSGPAGKKTS